MDYRKTIIDAQGNPWAPFSQEQKLRRVETIEEIYKLYREYIQHEDTLINHRTTWFVTIQSFLIATFGLTFQALFTTRAKFISSKGHSIEPIAGISDDFTLFLSMLAITGILISFVAIASISAAALALKSIKDHWQKTFASQAIHLPGITGGGHVNANRFGLWLSLAAPIALIGIWTTGLYHIYNPPHCEKSPDLCAKPWQRPAHERQVRILKVQKSPNCKDIVMCLLINTNR